MICKNCNQEISENVRFCPHCGTAVSQPEPTPAQPDVQPHVQPPVAGPVSDPFNNPGAYPGAYQNSPYQQPAPDVQPHVQPPVAGPVPDPSNNPGAYPGAYQTPPYQQPEPDTPPVYAAAPAQPPVNQTPYLVWSILVTILCCIPFGIPAIVYAAKINSALADGNYPLAIDSAKKSKIWILVGAIVGFVLLLVLCILVVAGLWSTSDFFYTYY